ncbi:hypothetical protein ACFYTC_22720 [Actinomadura nitritigenes]|uniref:hypothetical protein n=1 Tax=Actinomadura nitritigenes TaxID=134602 RepID=UPI003682A736
MTALADHHLTDLKHALHAHDIGHHAAQPAVRAELSQLLVRYHHQIATGFGVPHPGDHGVRAAAHRAATLITTAGRILGPHPTTEIPETPLAEKIRCVSLTLGCSLDLLASHIRTTLPVSPDAPTIAAPDTARALLHQLSDYLATTAHLARHTGVPASESSRLLLTAAVVSKVFGHAERAPINPVPLHHTPQRIPPAVDENFDQTVAGINTSIQRLNNPGEPSSVITWRYLARAAAIICDLNRKTILQLVYRMEELNKHQHIAHLKEVSPSIRATSSRWKAITRRWDTYDQFGHPTTGLATDASDLIIRLGRVIHTDPTWTPSPRASLHMKPPAELAATSADAARIATITLKAFEACNAIAAHHHTAINDLAAMNILQQQQQHPTHSPRVPASTRELLTLYQATQTAGTTTITALAHAIKGLTAFTPHHADEARLIARRATNKTRPNQSALAATGFPHSINECLSESKVESSRPEHSNRDHRSHRPSTP